MDRKSRDSQPLDRSMPKGKCNYNTRLLKGTMPYTVQEIAELYGLHKNAVRRWFQDGLRQIDKHKPYLVRGDELIRFLKARQSSRKIKCQPDEFYCLKCRAPRRAFGNMVDVVQENPRLVRVKTICEECGTPINKSQALSNMPAIEKMFDVQERGGFDLFHCTEPRLTVDMEKEDAPS